MAHDACYAGKSVWEPRERSLCGAKKKNYQRYPKPPYSYLAMIAMVIQNSPEKKLTLSEILKEISTLFPFFKGNYKGWRDSVRHNLSSYDCFVKVLKDPGKPQGKGNFWSVEVSRVPPELLKRQNTAVSRQDETVFAQDLAPYILQEPRPAPPRLDSTFAIDSLLHSLGPADRAEPSPALPQPYARSLSASPASDLSDEDWRGKRASDSCPPPNKSAKRGATPPWELPTSYAKYTPPNAVAPPSMRFNGGPLVPFYSYGGAHNHLIASVGRSYWPLLPSGPVSMQAPPLLMDLDSMLQSVPPNKSVFDALALSSQTLPNQYGFQSRASLCKY